MAKRIIRMGFWLSLYLGLMGASYAQGPDAPVITLRVKENAKISFNLSAAQDSTRVWIDAGTGENEKIYISKKDSTYTYSVKGRTLRILGNVSGFDCNGNAEVLVGLDLRACSTLRELNCCDCALGQLDLSGNPELTTLECADNSLVSLDLSHGQKLEWVDCHANRISSLELGACDSLQILDCSRNLLLNLDVSTCKRLEKLYCQANQLASLDVHGNPHIDLVSCYGNNISAMALEEMLRGLRVVGRQGGELYLDESLSHAPHSLRNAIQLAERKRWRVSYGEQ